MVSEKIPTKGKKNIPGDGVAKESVDLRGHVVVIVQRHYRGSTKRIFRVFEVTRNNVAVYRLSTVQPRLSEYLVSRRSLRVIDLVRSALLAGLNFNRPHVRVYHGGKPSSYKLLFLFPFEINAAVVRVDENHERVSSGE